MKYIISVDTQNTFELGGTKLSYAIIKDTREEGNDQWKYVKNSRWYENPSAHKAEENEFKTFDFFLIGKRQDEKPLFATTIFNDEMRRLFEQAYTPNRFCHVEKEILVLPNIPFDKMKFDVIESLDEEEYSNEYDDFMQINVVREKKYGIKYIVSEKNCRYDEMLTNREDVCEIRLHPFCSDFNLVRDIELEYSDYDM